MVQIKWTKLAFEDLKSIHEYISRDSVVYAKIQVVKLKYRTQTLKKFPFAGKLVPEFNVEDFRELLEGNYRIIYKIINEERVDILTIHHASRDLLKRDVF